MSPECRISHNSFYSILFFSDHETSIILSLIIRQSNLVFVYPPRPRLPLPIVSARFVGSGSPLLGSANFSVDAKLYNNLLL